MNSKQYLMSSPRPMRYRVAREPSGFFVGFLASEKMDGMYVRVEDGYLKTRSGKILPAVPGDIQAKVEALGELGLPVASLDCELFSPGGLVVPLRAQYGKWCPSLELVAFDIPLQHVPYTGRYRLLEHISARTNIKCVKQSTIHGAKDLRDLLLAVRSRKGEGLVLRHPGNMYAPGQLSPTIYKYKLFDQFRARVVDSRGKDIVVEDLDHPGTLYPLPRKRFGTLVDVAGGVFVIKHYGVTRNGRLRSASIRKTSISAT